MTGIIESGNVSLMNLTSAGHCLNLSFKVLIHMIRHHHEWYDGTGYQDALKGEEIPLGARIISVADAHVSMTTQVFLSGSHVSGGGVGGAQAMFWYQVSP